MSLGYFAAAADLGTFLAVFFIKNSMIITLPEGNNFYLGRSYTLSLSSSISVQINLRNPSKIIISELVIPRFRPIFTKWGYDVEEKWRKKWIGDDEWGIDDAARNR